MLLLPKLPFNQKHKLSLNHSTKHLFKQNQLQPDFLIQNDKKQNHIFFTKRKSQSLQKYTKSKSVQSKKPVKIDRNSLFAKRIQPNEKELQDKLIITKKQRSTVIRPILKLNVNNVMNSTPQVIINHEKQFSIQKQASNRNYMAKDQIIQNEKPYKTSLSTNNSLQLQSKINTSLNYNNPIKQYLQLSINKEISKSLNDNFQSVSLHQKPRKNSYIRHVNKNNFINSSNNDMKLNLYSSVYSFSIDYKCGKYQSHKKNEIIEQIINDPDFQWKYQKYRTYSQRYSEYQVQLRQNFQILSFLNENLELIKQRIIPFKSINSLKDITNLLKPTMTPKQTIAYQIKMEMLQWKKKLFTNATRIKRSISDGLQKKDQIFKSFQYVSENVLENCLAILTSFQKRETELQQKNKITQLEILIRKICENQKQMIDEVKIHERQTQFLIEKFGSIEQQWSRICDIFNSTLQSCIDKCICLSSLIQNYFGKSSSAKFWTKGINIQDPKDLKMIQNSKCLICKWNQIKIKKIIQQNSSAQDHLKALKHLVTN